MVTVLPALAHCNSLFNFLIISLQDSVTTIHSPMNNVHETGDISPKDVNDAGKSV